jgi:uncharacterized membrane protein HdeD (DUF308 family)
MKSRLAISLSIELHNGTPQRSSLHLIETIGADGTMLPFTLEQFLDVFATYNKAIWPAQIVAYLLGAIAVAALLRPGRASDRVVSAVLGLMWLCTGVLYHGTFFSSVNNAAFAFGTLFVVEGMALFYTGVVRDGLRFAINYGFRAVIGAGFILYASSRLSADRNRDGAFLAGLTDVRRSAVPGHDLYLRPVASDDPPLLLLASCDPLHLVTHWRQRCYCPRCLARLAAFG